MSENKSKSLKGNFAVRHIEHSWISMTDGTRLAARIWLPESADAVPAILEYIPYRKRDMVRARDERNHPFFAAHGFACLRVDMRGSGDSEGVMADMYSEDELDDSRQVIAWIAGQSWCNGRVGMFGTSWGGTASLQAAVNAPAPLKAVIANCATVDRFEDDIHWMGGCVLTDTLEWGATLPAILSAPPDAATVGEGWWQQWMDRLGQLTFPHQNWLRESARDPYWTRGSVRFEAERLRCPILTIGGWSDRYSNSVIRLVSARPDLCRGIVGPWGHHYPDQGEPGPAISFQDLALEWWKHWLCGEDGTIETWPALRIWQREFDPPQDRLIRRNGAWIELDMPSSGAISTWGLDGSGLTPEPSTGGQSFEIPFDLAHGQCSGDTGYFGRVGGLPLDQSPDDARSLCFDSAPLDVEMTLWGHAVLTVKVTPRNLPAQLVCRLCDVAPDGRSNLITRTVRNLKSGDDLEPAHERNSGQGLTVTVQFPSTVYKLAAGHKLRLAIGSSYWPLVWPENHVTRTTLSSHGAILQIPQKPGAARPLSEAFPVAKDLPEQKSWRVRAGPLERKHEILEDSGWHQHRVSVAFDDPDIGFSYETRVCFSCAPNEPDKAQCQVHHDFQVIRPDGIARASSQLTMWNGADMASTSSRVTVMWNDEVVNRIETKKDDI